MARGEITHVELPRTDPERAKRFYSPSPAGVRRDGRLPVYFLFPLRRGLGRRPGQGGESGGQRGQRVHHGGPLETRGRGRANGAGPEPAVRGPGQGRYAAVSIPSAARSLWRRPRAEAPRGGGGSYHRAMRLVDSHATSTRTLR